MTAGQYEHQPEFQFSSNMDPLLKRTNSLITYPRHVDAAKLKLYCPVWMQEAIMW